MRLTWGSLGESDTASGWLGLPLISIGTCELRAALHFPGRGEALLIGLRAHALPPGAPLPQGSGFTVDRIDPQREGSAWLALTRSPHASLELFEAMAADIVDALATDGSTDESRLASLFVGRIRAWQAFMRKGNQPLGAEAEVGLVGELFVLKEILASGLPASLSLEGWLGPFGGAQDFQYGHGALESKATVSPVGFIARIDSLQQLDDTLRSPIYITAVRLKIAESGCNLPELVAATQLSIAEDPEARQMLEERLLAAGYRHAHAESYLRRFLLSECSAILVGDEFPRLATGNVPVGVVWATYEINLDAAPGVRVDIGRALTNMGAL
jgi:hypothetical protein